MSSGDAAAQALAERLVRSAVDGSGPGVAVGLYRDGAMIGHACAGLADIERQAEIGASTVFDIASVSKQVFSAALVLLARDGLLDLDGDIRETIPELSLRDRVTWRQCAQHTAGLRDYLVTAYALGLPWSELATQPQAVAAIARQRHTDFAPGSDIVYSNSGYLLIGEAVARASGRPAASVLAERVFAPLGMAASRVRQSIETGEDEASSYAAVDGVHVRQVPYETLVGDGGVLTSITDLAGWLGFLADGRGLGPDVLARLTEPAVLTDGTRCRYAMGLRHAMVGAVPVLGHGGRMYDFRAQLLTAPGHGAGVALLANRADLPLERWASGLVAAMLEPGPRHRAACRAAMAETAGSEDPAQAADPAAAAPAAAEPADGDAERSPRADRAVDGLWSAPRNGTYLLLRTVDDGVQLDRLDGQRPELLAADPPDGWRGPEDELTLVRAGDGRLLLRGALGRVVALERAGVEPMPADLARDGRFVHQETGATAGVSTVVGAVQLSFGGGEPAGCSHVTGGTVVAAGLTVTLPRAGQPLRVVLPTGSALLFTPVVPDRGPAAS